jgi:hypothetical protein
VCECRRIPALEVGTDVYDFFKRGGQKIGNLEFPILEVQKSSVDADFYLLTHFSPFAQDGSLIKLVLNRQERHTLAWLKTKKP